MSPRPMSNVPYAEIEIGKSASLSRVLTQTTLEVLALLSGDVDPFVLEGDHREDVRPDSSTATE